MRTVICPTQLHFHDIASHFLALTAGDRFLRFGWVMSDVDIVAYVEGLLHAIGNVPRCGSAQSSGMRCAMKSRLSPSGTETTT